MDRNITALERKIAKCNSLKEEEKNSAKNAKPQSTGSWQRISSQEEDETHMEANKNDKRRRKKEKKKKRKRKIKREHECVKL